MSTSTLTRPTTRLRRKRGRLFAAGVATLAIIAMALDTTIITIGSEQDSRSGEFSAERFGTERFPEIRDAVQRRAVDAVELASAIAEDKAAASQEYGVMAGIGPVMPVRFSGVAGEAKAGIYEVSVAELPASLVVRVQTGPAINGTDLRDATGEISFGQFTNQIEYQNAGAAINGEMKRQVLADIDAANLSGKTVDVVGVFKLINPNHWLITPVALEVR
ncbi:MULTISPECIES: DUF2291 family protein [unclassified Halomonas]|uniref:DUF2291 family protein n=1 Tax=unclassified Halomonas TaxID=2609666 RepID=UPI001C958C2B|nr:MULTISPECIES: DUF2291 domain-containing protein [unclassified Halomonas]MBY5925219.1 DUF2291 domain-containing protein [Halomonas sp. DP4Y7-2]MBY6232260.1 DUF2291 domain-containing protein [Halomonas sp. DP4Y7-1]